MSKVKFQFPFSVPETGRWKLSDFAPESLKQPAVIKAVTELVKEIKGVRDLAKSAAWPFPTFEEEQAIPEVPPVRTMYVFDRRYPKGGITLVYQKCTPYKNCKMVRVAVAYCSQYDVFSKKRGRIIAMENFQNGQWIEIPARLIDDDSIEIVLQNMFQPLVGSY